MRALALIPSSGLGTLLLVAALSCPAPVRAQTSAAAQALFDEGQALMKQGKAAEACPKFEESLKLDEALGTLLNLAECYKRAGRSASAWSRFTDAATMARAAGQVEREQFASGRAKELEPLLGKLTIVVSDEARGVTALRIRRDRDDVGSAQWGLAVPLDAGRHSVVAEAPGYAPFRQEVTITDGQTVQVRVPPLVAAATGKPTEATGPVAPAGAAASPPPADASPGRGESGGSTGRTLGVVSMALGGAALVASGVLGLVAKSQHDSAVESDDCAGNACNAEGYAARQDAVILGNIATVCGIGGAVLVGGGAVLWFAAAPPRDSASSGFVVGARGQW